MQFIQEFTGWKLTGVSLDWVMQIPSPVLMQRLVPTGFLSLGINPLLCAPHPVPSHVPLWWLQCRLPALKPSTAGLRTSSWQVSASGWGRGHCCPLAYTSPTFSIRQDGGNVLKIRAGNSWLKSSSRDLKLSVNAFPFKLSSRLELSVAAHCGSSCKLSPEVSPCVFPTKHVCVPLTADCCR